MNGLTMCVGAVLAGLSIAAAAASPAQADARRHPRSYEQWPGAGSQVEEVALNTPAARAGLRPGDIVTAIDGRPVNGSDDITRAMERSGRSVVVDIARAGSRLRVRITPRPLTRSEMDEYVAPHRRVLGIVHTERRFILRPGTGANDVYIPPPIPPDPPPPPPMPN